MVSVGVWMGSVGVCGCLDGVLLYLYVSGWFLMVSLGVWMISVGVSGCPVGVCGCVWVSGWCLKVLWVSE